jgi:hypothetical protein
VPVISDRWRFSFLFSVANTVPSSAQQEPILPQPAPVTRAPNPPTRDDTNINILLTPLVVSGRQDSLVGVARSAAEGVVGQDELSQRPIFRPGEVLETVPRMIVTQHAGGGKANQYFLRGFNLDHGTDAKLV